MTWQPQEEPLRQLAQYLKDSLSGSDKTVQKNAEIMLKHATESPDYTNYLTYLFSSAQQPASINLSPENYDIARSAAAIMLKNSVKTSYKSIPEPSKSYIRSVIIQGLQDPSFQIRNYTGNVITELVRQGGILAWPQLLSELFDVIESKSGQSLPVAQEAAMSALLKICEDNKRALDREYSGERPLVFLFPKLLEFTTSPLAKIRATALASINVFITENWPIVTTNLPAILQHLFNLASDPSNDVRKHVCRSFLHIAEISPESIIPNLEGLVNYTIVQQKNQEDAELALDAAEFWFSVGEDENLVQYLGPYLPKIIPVLLESMVYGEDDILRLEGEQEDDEQEDKVEDIKPAFAATKSARITSSNGEASAGGGGGGSGGNGVNGAPQEDDMSEGEIDDEDNDTDDDEDDDEFGSDPEDQWTLRKCSAAALDVLASYFREHVFEVTLPYLKENLQHKDWPYREAAVLALGAIADGCMEVVQPHLPDLTNYLLTLLQDGEPVVRQITCWTLGRYSSWAAHLDDAGRRVYFEPIMDGILKRMLDRNKRVQEAAASAFANLEEKAKTQLQPYCGVIIRQFVQCFSRYKDRNMFILYDCVQTLAEHIGPQLKDPELVNLLMPALIARWNKVSDQSREMFPLLECLSYVATALTETFDPFSDPIFTRCIKIIHQNLEDAIRAGNNPAMDLPEKDFLVTSLDLLSAIIQALDERKSASLVAGSQPNMFELLVFCMKDDNNDVRQSAYALLGDCAIYVFEQLQPFLPVIIETLVIQLDITHVHFDGEETNYSVINNACWSIGEIAMREKEGMRPFVESLLEKLATILFNHKIPDSLSENAAIALGRLGTGCPEALAPHLATIAPPFLKAISHSMWADEKAHALIGFVKTVSCNPQAMEGCLLDFFVELAAAPSAFLRYGDGSRLLMFRTIVGEYKKLIPDFDNFINMMPAERQRAFRAEYLS